MSQTLAAKLEALRVSREQAAPLPLKVLLFIYSNATYDCTYNYNLGTKALLKYLGSPEIPYKEYPEISNSGFRVPVLLGGGYNSQELARLIAGSRTDYKTSAEYLIKLRHIRNAIYFVTRDLIVEMYGYG